MLKCNCNCKVSFENYPVQLPDWYSNLFNQKSIYFLRLKHKQTLTIENVYCRKRGGKPAIDWSISVRKLAHYGRSANKIFIERFNNWSKRLTLCKRCEMLIDLCETVKRQHYIYRWKYNNNCQRNANKSLNDLPWNTYRDRLKQ